MSFSHHFLLLFFVLNEFHTELQEYQKLTTTRRALEYTVYDQEMKEAEQKLREIDNLQQRSEEGDERLLAEEDEGVQRKRYLETELTSLEDELQQLQTARKNLR